MFGTGLFPSPATLSPPGFHLPVEVSSQDRPLARTVLLLQARPKLLYQILVRIGELVAVPYPVDQVLQVIAELIVCPLFT